MRTSFTERQPDLDYYLFRKSPHRSNSLGRDSISKLLGGICESLGYEGDILREGSSPLACHVPQVMRHVTHIMCLMSCNTYIYIFFFLSFGQSGEAVWWRVCYQRATPSS